LTVRLRAHHLLCMLTFVGEGYTPAFTDGYRRIAARLSAGEAIEIVSGPDDICAPLLAETSPHCFKPGVVLRDEAAAEAVGHLLGREIGAGAVVVPDAGLLEMLRAGFASGSVRRACEGCEWGGLCSRIAQGGFANTLVAAG
jgi:hypothetical protein